MHTSRATSAPGTAAGSSSAGVGQLLGTSVEVADAVALRLELSEVNLPAGTDSGSTAWAARRAATTCGACAATARSSRRSSKATGSSSRSSCRTARFPTGRASSCDACTSCCSPQPAQPVRRRACRLGDASCYGTERLSGDQRRHRRDHPVPLHQRRRHLRLLGGLLNDNAPATLEPWILTANRTASGRRRKRSRSTPPSSTRAVVRRRQQRLRAQVRSAPISSRPRRSRSGRLLLRAIDPLEVPPGVFYLGWTSRAAGRRDDPPPPLPSGDGWLATAAGLHSQIALDETPTYLTGGDGITVANFLHGVNQAGTGTSGSARARP
ncbi:MAG: hypothetical protein R2862_05535 [Thermoanaerobaculia bacterium]